MNKEDLYKFLFNSLENSRTFFKKLLFVVTASFVLILIYTKYDLDTKDRYTREIQYNNLSKTSIDAQLKNLGTVKYQPGPELVSAKKSYDEAKQARLIWLNKKAHQQVSTALNQHMKETSDRDELIKRLTKDGYSADNIQLAVKLALEVKLTWDEYSKLEKEDNALKAGFEEDNKSKIAQLKNRLVEIDRKNTDLQNHINTINNSKTSVPGLGVSLYSQHILPLIPMILGMLIFICISKELEYLALLNKPGMREILETLRKENMHIFYLGQDFYGAIIRNMYLMIAILVQVISIIFALVYHLKVFWLWEVSTFTQYFVQFTFAAIPFVYLSYLILAHDKLYRVARVAVASEESGDLATPS